MDERSGGNGRDGRRGDDVDGFGDPDDETVVIVSSEYTRRAIARLVDGLRDAASVGDGVGTLEPGAGSEAEAIAILAEFEERLGTLGPILEGARRAVHRHRLERQADFEKANQTKEQTP
jgi:hypothetical protein